MVLDDVNDYMKFEYLLFLAVKLTWKTYIITNSLPCHFIGVMDVTESQFSVELPIKSLPNLELADTTTFQKA